MTLNVQYTGVLIIKLVANDLTALVYTSLIRADGSNYKMGVCIFPTPHADILQQLRPLQFSLFILQCLYHLIFIYILHILDINLMK